MSVIDELATYLSANGGGSVFAGPIPSEPDTASALLLYGGLKSLVKFGGPGIYREQPTFQVISRGPQDDQAAAYTQAKLVHDILTNLNLPLLIGGVRYYTLTVRIPARLLQQDEQSRYIFVASMGVMKDPS